MLNAVQIHDLIREGVPVNATKKMFRHFTIVKEQDLFHVIGISPRTMQRRETLDQNASDRAVRLATVTDQAVEVLGSQDAAERWLSQAAVGLDQRRPIDLLQSSEGTELVKELLTRIEHGVYA